MLSLAETFANVPSDVRQSLKTVIASNPDHVIQRSWNALADSSIWKEDVIMVPVEMILGSGSFSIWPADYEQRVRKLASNLEFQKIEGAGHSVMLVGLARSNARNSRRSSGSVSDRPTIVAGEGGSFPALSQFGTNYRRG
jgi:pimeloyl-ACP methyl ester carboxylesterase